MLIGTQVANSMITALIRKLLPTCSEISFCYECRDTNVPTHNIAKNSLDLAPGRHVSLLNPLNSKIELCRVRTRELHAYSSVRGVPHKRMALWFEPFKAQFYFYLFLSTW